MIPLSRRLAALALVIALGATAVAEDDAATYRKLLDEKSENLVTVRFVQKIRFSVRGSSQEQERNAEINGTIVSAEGLIMVSNLELSPRAPRGLSFTSDSPTDIQVRFGNEEEEYEAVLAAVDSQLQLGFFRIKDLKERKLVPVLFDRAQKLEIGQELFSAHRHARGFDYAAELGSFMVTGRIAQPRKAFCTIGTIGKVGLPVFALDGTAVGVLSILDADVGAGQGGQIRCILPNDVVDATIKQAAEKAEEVLAKGDKDSTESKKDDEGSTDEPERDHSDGGDDGDDGDGDDGDGDGMGGGER